jgi:hypothetical protein
MSLKIYNHCSILTNKSNIRAFHFYSFVRSDFIVSKKDVFNYILRVIQNVLTKLCNQILNHLTKVSLSSQFIV